MDIGRARDRTGIKKEVSDTKNETDKRIRDGQKVVSDKRVVSDAAKSLRLGGTSEGIKDIKNKFKKAGDATDREHKKKGQELKKRVFDRARKTERELEKRSNEVAKDVARLGQAAAKLTIRETKTEARSAEKAAEKDKKFLGDTKKKQEQQRTSAEKRRKKQEQEVNAAKIRFRD